MSQKVNPHALRSQWYQNKKSPTSIHENFFSEPRNSKWGLNSYSRIFHEDQSIEKYLEGFFRSFGFYQQTCVIERKCNRTIHVTAYVLRTPQVRTNPNIIHRTPKEKVLQEGLDLPVGNSTKVGWVPTLLLQTITKILSDSNIQNYNFSTSVPLRGKNQTVISHKSDKSPQHDYKTPNLTPIISSNGDYNSELQQQTEESRFKSYWNNLLAVSESDVDMKYPVGVSNASASWWSHRTWHTKIVTPMGWQEYEESTVHSGSWLWSRPNKCQQEYNLSLSIVPVQSLSDSSKLIADYMADKIEQSTPLQGLFQEITNIIKVSDDMARSAHSDPHIDTKSDKQVPPYTLSMPKASTPPGLSCSKPIIGFRLSCSGRIQKNAYAKPAEMADSLTITKGVLPLNSFSHNIEFTQTSSTNAFGTCGIKVWINRGTYQHTKGI